LLRDKKWPRRKAHTKTLKQPNPLRRLSVLQHRSQHQSQHQNPTPKAEPAKPVEKIVVMNFDRWFATLGKPEHHKAGMKIYRKSAVKGKRTAAAWQELFKNY